MSIPCLICIIIICLCATAIICISADDDDILSCVCAGVLCLLAVGAFIGIYWAGKKIRDCDNTIIDQENCIYIGAEVYQATDDKAVFIDINSGDLYAYTPTKQIDEAAQYMLTVDADTGEVLVVWQNMD